MKIGKKAAKKEQLKDGEVFPSHVGGGGRKGNVRGQNEGEKGMLQSGKRDGE